MTSLEITEEMRKEIVERSSAIIARASLPKGLLSCSDLSALTGFPYHGKTFQGMIREPDFPRAVLVGTREKRWFAGEIFRWLERRRDYQTT